MILKTLNCDSSNFKISSLHERVKLKFSIIWEAVLILWARLCFVKDSANPWWQKQTWVIFAVWSELSLSYKHIAINKDTAVRHKLRRTAEYDSLVPIYYFSNTCRTILKTRWALSKHMPMHSSILHWSHFLSQILSNFQKSLVAVMLILLVLSFCIPLLFAVALDSCTAMIYSSTAP